MANDDPFGFVGRPQGYWGGKKRQPMIIVAQPGQEIRIIVDDGSGQYASGPLPPGDHDDLSPSPSPDHDDLSPSPSPDHDDLSPSPSPDHDDLSPSPSPDYGYPESYGDW